jgi:RHS repeat-associated protein
MKRLLLLITFLILRLFSFTQINVQQDNRVNQILKGALASKSGFYIYGRTSASRFINIAVLNQASHTLCWFTCHGRLFDSTKLTDSEYQQVTSRHLDPFALYQNICDSYLAEMAAARDLYRIYSVKQSFDRLNSRYRALFAMETVQAAKTSLQKLIAIENAGKKILTQLAYLNCANPSTLSHDPLYATNKEQAGKMVKTNDSTVYYNIDPTSAVAKISLYKKSAGQFYIQNRSSDIIDSVAIQPEKCDLLQKEKTDVFLLYRGWLEMQWQGALSAIRRQSAVLYNQVNVQNEKEVKELYNQLNAIGAKINQLISPETKSIERAVYDTYKNETSEISYIPLLGIGYSLIQTRGAKEYELTNHLGNLLATVSDKKIGVSSASNSSLVDHYEPDIVSAQDYYPFGMLQPGRSYLSPNGGKYRYGFNGKENDNEVKGDGNQQDYGMRVYDPRIGKFLSVDPLIKQYPELTPYQFASNTPISAIDLDGSEAKISIEKNTYFVVLTNIHFRWVQRKSTEYFTQATKDFPRHDFSINTQMFDYSNAWDYFRASTPQPISDYTSQGQNVANGKVVSGRSANKTFYFAHGKDGSWSTGFGDVPNDAKFGVGGGTPIVINGLKFGEKNVFTEDAPERVKAIGEKGWIEPADWKFLKQKSSGVYAGQNDKKVGKTIVGFNSKNSTWIIVSQQNEKEGFTLDEIRDRLVSQGYNNVLAFDGSSSSTLVENGKPLVSPDKRKNSTIPSGLNFSVPEKK